MARKRHLSRIAVMQVLFERRHRPVDTAEALARTTAELGEVDGDFARTLLEGVLLHEEQIKEAVCAHAPDWSFDRMDPISRCVLLIGAFEILFAHDAPPAVVMNEAIDIAKEYGTEESGKFVNGVLNAVAHGSEG